MMEKENILKSRAKLLAKPISEEIEENEALEVVAFFLADELYAVESSFIQEVYPVYNITSLPNAPSFVRGLINVRRKVISVIDLKILFSLPINERTSQEKVIILDNNKMQFAILADRVSETLKIPIGCLIKTLPTLTGVRSEFLKGITKDQMIVLDGQKLMDCEAVLVNEKV